MAREAVPPRLTRLGAAIAAVVVTVAITGCGGSSSSSSSTTTSSGSRSSDAATAQQINLKLSDLPSGWQAQPVPQKNSTGNQALLNCLHLSNTNVTRTADVSSPIFVQRGAQEGSELQAHSDVTVKSGTASVQRDYAAISGPGAAGCIQSVIQTGLSHSFAGKAQSSVTATSTPPPNAGGNRVVAYLVNATATLQGQTIPAAQGTLVFFTHGRRELLVSGLGLLGESFPPSLLSSLVAVVAERANTTPT